jgi:hypothetical protein
MQAYKVKGKIDQAGRLVITESINLTPGEVEVIVLQLSSTDISLRSDSTLASTEQATCEIPSLKLWLEQSPPVPPNFDPEQAKWEYLKEKHNL